MQLCEMNNLKLPWKCQNLKVCYCLWKWSISGWWHFSRCGARIWLSESPNSWTVNVHSTYIVLYVYYNTYCYEHLAHLWIAADKLYGEHRHTNTHAHVYSHTYTNSLKGVGKLNYCSVSEGKKSNHGLIYQKFDLDPGLIFSKYPQDGHVVTKYWKLSIPTVPPDIFPGNHA